MPSLSASNFLSKRSAIASILSRSVRTSALMSADVRAQVRDVCFEPRDTRFHLVLRP